ncbi:beta-ketoacyl synthase chain length factor [Vibrio astriarenae]
MEDKSHKEDTMGFDIDVCLGQNLIDRVSTTNTNSSISFSSLEPSVAKTYLRRSSYLTRQVLSFSEFIFDSEPDYLIFGSQHGELNRTVKLLYSIANNTELSPTQFAQSVHSTAPGMLTIANNKPVPFTTICAGKDTLVMAMVEAIAHITNFPEQEVCIILADEEVPLEWAHFVGEEGHYTFAIKLRLGGSYSPVMTDSKSLCDQKYSGFNVENMLGALIEFVDFELKSTSFNLLWKMVEDDEPYA